MTMASRMRDYQAFDLRWCHAANRWGERPGVHRFFAIISRMGDGWIWLALMFCLALACGARGITAALHMLATGMIASVLYRALKQKTRRLRPYRSHAGVMPRVSPLDEFSFPSGHTLHAVSFTIVAIAWFPFLAPPLILLTLAIAMSRVVLGLHYPTDVLAGALIGAALGCVSVWSCPGHFLAMA